MMLCFSLITFLFIGDAVGGGPLHQAAKKGNLDEVRRLIEDGANVNVNPGNRTDVPIILC